MRHITFKKLRQYTAFIVLTFCMVIVGPYQRVWADVSNDTTVYSNTTIPDECLNLTLDSEDQHSCIIRWYTTNNISIYDPNDQGSQNDASCGGSGGLVGNDNLEKIYNWLRGKGLNDTQTAAVVGNIDAESRGDPTLAQTGGHTNDPSKFGTGVGVGKAWGIIQWDAGGRAIEYAKQAGIKGPIYELATQLDLVWWHMNNYSPTSAKNMMSGFKAYTSESQIKEAVTYYHGKMEGSADSSMANRVAKAKNALKLYGGAVSSPSADGTTTTTNNCAGAASGDIVQTAINYAWPTYHAPPYTTKKPAYATAVQKAIKDGSYVGGGQYPGVDCGGFVTRVMQDSGADPNYNNKRGNTTAQRTYMISSGKYTEIKNPTSADMKPGDIAVNDEHTYMYVGDNKAKGFKSDIASASISYSGRSWRAPMAGREVPADPNYRWFRLK